MLGRRTATSVRQNWRLADGNIQNQRETILLLMRPMGLENCLLFLSALIMLLKRISLEKSYSKGSCKYHQDSNVIKFKHMIHLLFWVVLSNSNIWYLYCSAQGFKQWLPIIKIDFPNWNYWIEPCYVGPWNLWDWLIGGVSWCNTNRVLFTWFYQPGGSRSNVFAPVIYRYFFHITIFWH